MSSSLNFWSIWVFPQSKFCWHSYVLILLTLESWKAEWPWSHPVVLNTQPLDWESSTLTNGSLLHTFLLHHSVHRGINCSLKITPSPLSCQAPLKSANSPRPPFLGNPPYILFFWNLYSPKYQIFPWTSTISIFSIYNPILTFKNCEILTRNFPVLIHSYDREKHFCLHTFFVIKGFRLFLM